MPISYLYCLLAIINKTVCKKRLFDIPIISVGNIVVGGSGKTPLIKTIASKFEQSAVILRGYGRKSRGLVQVSRAGEILVDIQTSGDEAMELAKALPYASVYVSENRFDAIERAVKDGAKIIFLDDAYRHCINKFDILLKKKSRNPFCLPAGPYRLPPIYMKKADLVLEEGKDFFRNVWIKDPTKKMVLLTSIADPKRLDPYLPKGIKRYHFEDHHMFEYAELEKIWQKERPDSFLVTRKDLVKLERFPFRYSVLELDLRIDPKVFEKIEKYSEGFNAKKDSNGSYPS